MKTIVKNPATNIAGFFISFYLKQDMYIYNQKSYNLK